MSLPVRLLLLALLGLGVYVGIHFITAKAPTSARTVQTDWISSKQCMECHEDVWAEWHGSHHQIAYTNPEVRQLSNDFRNKECRTCHQPRPIFETGISSRPLSRTSFPDEGVSCLTCHLGPDGGIVGRHDVPDAPCAPVRNVDFLSVDLCAACHNQHWTTDQFHASTWPDKGFHCNTCHMPEVARGSGTTGYHHGFPGAHDEEMLRRAAAVTATMGDGELEVTVTNVGAGHSFPTEERHRAVDVEWRAHTADGAVPTVGWERMHRFRMYYLDEGGRDDQLPPDGTWGGTANLPEGTTRVEVAVWYRLQPLATNDDPASTLLWQTELTAEAPTWASPAEAAFAPRAIDLRDLVDAARSAAAYEPQVEEFQRLVDDGPEPPPSQTLAQLDDLRDTAFAGDGNSRLERLSQRALLEDPDAFWSLESGLAHDNQAVASHAAFHLGELQHVPSLDPLVKRLKYELDPVNLVWVVLALHRLGNDSGLPVLAQLMARADSAEQAGGVAVQILGGELEPGLASPLSEQPTYAELTAGVMELWDHWRTTGVGSLTTAPEPAATLDGMAPLLRSRLAARMIELTGNALRPVDDCKFIFARLGITGLPVLQLALGSAEPYIRVHALEVLGLLGPVGAALAGDVAPLLDDPITATKAAEALGAMGAEEFAPRLRRWLAGEVAAAAESTQAAAIHERRIAAAEALGLMRDEASRSELARLMAAEDTPIDLAVHAAFGVAMLDRASGGTAEDSAGRAFLADALERQRFHLPTLRELIDRLDGRP